MGLKPSKGSFGEKVYTWIFGPPISKVKGYFYGINLSRDLRPTQKILEALKERDIEMNI